MELTSRMKMARFQTFWIHMRKNKPLDESRKTGQTSHTKMKRGMCKTKRIVELHNSTQQCVLLKRRKKTYQS
ncbi:hypothetical protein Hanom_Chr12g01066931 [Helianthus anomalus]